MTNLNASTGAVGVGGDVQGNVTVTNITRVDAPSSPLRSTPPAPPAHFTGREEYIARFTQLLTQGESVAITALHGMGGIGKTSLAQKLAEQLQGRGDPGGRPYFPGGVLWWSIGPKPDVFTALDVWARHADPRSDLSALSDASARANVVRSMLAQLGKVCVVIDDVWDEASFNTLKEAVPSGCPILITTRDADLAKSLRCRVERIDALKDDEAVALLVKLLGPLETDEHPERTLTRSVPKRESKDALSAALDIAHLTEGLPLALELICGLADSPADLPSLANQLRSQPTLDVLKRSTTREQSIEACFTLSYTVLDADMQRRFRALGVFAPAPFDHDAIAAVWNEDGNIVDASIKQLVRRSLLSKADDAGEYRQHALLRAYAIALLYPYPYPPPSTTSVDRGGNDLPSPVPPPLRDGGRAGDGGHTFAVCHANHYRRFAKEKNWHAVEHFFDQIDHGWRWVQANAHDQIIDYVFAVLSFLRVRGRQGERLERLNAGLEHARSIKDQVNEGRFLHEIGFAHSDIGFAHSDIGHQRDALTFYQQAVAIYRELNYRRAESASLVGIGNVYFALGKMPNALATYQQALAITREVGDRSGEGTTLNNLGEVYRALGKMPDALATYQQALAITREVGDRAGEGATLNNIGAVYRALGQTTDALDYYQQSLAITREVGDQWHEALLLFNIGLLLDEMDRTAEAVTYLKQCVALDEAIGHPDLESDRAALDRVQGKLGKGKKETE